MEFINLQAQYQALKDDINENIHEVLNSSQYMMGKYIDQLEQELAKYVGTKYCITCANGTDALQLALMAMNVGVGDAVFVPDFTFFSTAEVVSALGATPIFVDVDESTFNINPFRLEEAVQRVIKKNELSPKAVIPVDLFGLPADYSKIQEITTKYDLFIIEDGAQGFGGCIGSKRACSFGDISTTSFFPAKPLGCYGDGGAIFTDNDNYNTVLRSLRIHGKGEFKYDNIRIGMNSRLDEIQAGILLPKLKAFKEYELTNRNIIANRYTKNLKDLVRIPFIANDFTSSWAQYTVLMQSEKEREYVKNYLKSEDIPTMIYYPKPLHQQTVYQGKQQDFNDLSVSTRISKICLSLPMHPYLTEKDQNKIITSFISAVGEFRDVK